MSGAALFVACLNFAGHSLERVNSRLALRLDPLNTDARMGLIVNEFSTRNSRRAILEQMLGTGRPGLALAPMDGRLWSLLGEIEGSMGDEAAAESDYHRALAVSRTEINALLNLFEIAARRGDYARAIDLADIMFRRWAGRSGKVRTALLAIAADPAGYAALHERLMTGPPWRDRLLSAFASAPKAAMTGAALAIDLAAAGHAQAPAAVSALERELIRSGQPEEAYRLFLLTRTHEQSAKTGFIFDGHFRLAPDGNPFGWRLESRAGYEVARLPAGGLSMRFFDAPVTRMDVAQTLTLPPGNYRLETRAAAFAARFPKGISWTVRCRSNRRVAARLDISEGSYAFHAAITDFSIDGQCPVQELQLETGLDMESWQYRYSGSLQFESITIRQAGT